MKGVSLWFMLLAVVAVILGMVWGIQMSASGDHSLSPAHGHLNLLGWVSCAIFAFYYHLNPGAAEGLLPKVHFALWLVTLGMMAPGIALAIQERTDVLAKVSSLLGLGAMVLFLVIVIRAAKAGQASARPANA
jgi:drug/metabolite transporter (DMT)-like permease